MTVNMSRYDERIEELTVSLSSCERRAYQKGGRVHSNFQIAPSRTASVESMKTTTLKRWHSKSMLLLDVDEGVEGGRIGDTRVSARESSKGSQFVPTGSSGDEPQRNIGYLSSSSPFTPGEGSPHRGEKVHQMRPARASAKSHFSTTDRDSSFEIMQVNPPEPMQAVRYPSRLTADDKYSRMRRSSPPSSRQLLPASRPETSARHHVEQGVNTVHRGRAGLRGEDVYAGVNSDPVRLRPDTLLLSLPSQSNPQSSGAQSRVYQPYRRGAPETRSRSLQEARQEPDLQ